MPSGAGGAGGYAMAKMDRLLEDWVDGTVSNDSLLASQLTRMRNRSRGFARNDDYMKSFLGACRRNIIGPSGVNLQMEVLDPPRPVTKNGKTEWVAEPDTAANDAIEDAYDLWSKPACMDNAGRWIPHYCTNGRMGRVQFGLIGITTAARDGEFFFRKVRNFDNPFGFAVQPINPDYVDELKNEVLSNGDEIRMGVQRNMDGRVTHYWLRTWNPADTFWPSHDRGSYISKPFPAEDIGHFYIPMDFDESRGTPWIHAGANRLKMLSGYEEAALVAARSAACKHEYLEQSIDPQAPPAEYKGDAVDAFGRTLSDVEPGMRELLPRGVTAKSIDPKFPHPEHGGFITSILTGIAAGLEMSYATLAGDLSNANYSSLRAGLLPERDMWQVLQNLWILQVELPLFYDWLRMALLKNAIVLKNGSPLPADRWMRFAAPRMNGRRWPWVDPQKDQEANAIALKQRTTSRVEVISQQGGDVDDTFRNIARTKELAAKHGITLPEDVEAIQELSVAKAAAQGGGKEGAGKEEGAGKKKPKAKTEEPEE